MDRDGNGRHELHHSAEFHRHQHQRQRSWLAAASDPRRQRLAERGRARHHSLCDSRLWRAHDSPLVEPAGHLRCGGARRDDATRLRGQAGDRTGWQPGGQRQRLGNLGRRLDRARIRHQSVRRHAERRDLDRPIRSQRNPEQLPGHRCFRKRGISVRVASQLRHRPVRQQHQHSRHRWRWPQRHLRRKRHLRQQHGRRSRDGWPGRGFVGKQRDRGQLHRHRRCRLHRHSQRAHGYLRVGQRRQQPLRHQLRRRIRRGRTQLDLWQHRGGRLHWRRFCHRGWQLHRHDRRRATRRCPTAWACASKTPATTASRAT